MIVEEMRGKWEWVGLRERVGVVAGEKDWSRGGGGIKYGNNRWLQIGGGVGISSTSALLDI